MKKIVCNPGVRLVLKEYHSVMAVVLEQRKQTQKQAAKQLKISVTTFNKIYRCRYLPNFHSRRGKKLAERFVEWSTLKNIYELFPEFFFTEKYLSGPKTYIVDVPFALIPERNGESKKVTLLLPPAGQPSEPRIIPGWRRGLGKVRLSKASRN